MNNEKMREAFDKLLSKNEGQFSNTSFSIFKEGYQAALAQQSEPETAKAKWNATADEHNQWDELGQDEKNELESAQVSQASSLAKCPCDLSTNCTGDNDGCVDPKMGLIETKSEPVQERQESVILLSAVFDAWENGTECTEEPYGEGSYIGTAFKLDDDIFKRCCNLLNRVNPPRNSSPPDYEATKRQVKILETKVDHFKDCVDALKSENETLKEITNTMFIVAPSDYEALKAENADLKLRVAELEAKSTMDVNQLKRIFEQRDGLEVERDKLQRECDQLRNRPFECWSNDDGDSWCSHPADSEFVGGLKVGDTFELLAGYDSVRVKYVVTKAPDDVDDDYEVEQVK